MAEGKNKVILGYFMKAIEAGRLAHGYLFYGPQGVGKKNTAFWLADFLKTSPFDVLYIVPEEGKKDISIKQIKETRRHLSLSSYNSQYKFAIIDRAELMNSESANALLKTLEEPQDNTILILITTKPDLLPKTIISRLQEIRFRSVSLNEISKGFINKDYVNLLQKPLNDVFKQIELISKNETEISSLLDCWLFWFRDLMLKESSYAGAVKEIQRTKDLISTTNINKRLALENLVLMLK